MTITNNNTQIIVTLAVGETLSYTLNCGDIITPTLTSTTYTINSPEQGVYCFTSVLNSVVTKKSLFVDQGLKCEFANYIKNTEDYEKYYMYEAMILALECNDCNCETACWFYNRILNELNNDCC